MGLGEHSAIAAQIQYLYLSRAGYYQNLVQWSKGEYANANNKEDDLTLISSFVPFRTDDFGNTCASAALLTPAATMRASGVIERTGDVDTFAFVAPAGSIVVGVALSAGSPNLDAKATLLSSSCAVLATWNPTATLAIASTTYVTAAGGTFHVQVTGAGLGSPLATGYSAYDSLGAYTVSVSLIPLKSASSSRPRTTSSTARPPTATPSRAWSTVTSSTGRPSSSTTRLGTTTTALPNTISISIRPTTAKPPVTGGSTSHAAMNTATVSSTAIPSPTAAPSTLAATQMPSAVATVWSLLAAFGLLIVMYRSGS